MNEIAASLIYIYTKEALYKEEVEKYEEVNIIKINRQLKKKLIFFYNLILGNMLNQIFISYSQP